MRVLVTTASKHGATLGIADAIAEELTKQGLNAVSQPVEDVSEVGQYDAVVLGSAIYFGHWLKAAIEFADVNFLALSQRPLWLFSSGPVEEASSAAPPVTEASPLQSLTPLGHRVFLGALDKSQLGLVERSVVRAVHGEYGDFREWDDVRSWAGDIAVALKGRQAEAQR
jgi:menaquinone-dependent protoporphyrinogen oxidase